SPWVDRSRRPATVRPDGWSSPSLAEGHRIRLTGRLVPTLPCGSCPARLDVNSFPRLRTVSYPVDISVFTFNGRGSDDYAPGPRPLAARRPRPALPGTAPPGTAVAARPCPPAGREEERMHEVGADHHRRADPGRHVLRPGLGRGRRRHSAVETSTTLPAPAPADAEPSDAVPEAAPEPAPEQQPEPEAADPEPAAPEVPREHQNALKAAERYLAYTSFSKQGLVEQL